jgi:hypothetical protein
MKRFAMLGLLILSCGDPSAPCSTCPPIAGTWALQYGSGISSGCDHAGFDAMPATLLVTQQSSVLHASFDALSLSGSLFDNYQFRLTGTGAPSADGGLARAVELRGLYVPASTDGGERILDGNLSRNLDTCDEETPFTAVRP